MADDWRTRRRVYRGDAFQMHKLIGSSGRNNALPANRFPYVGVRAARRVYGERR